MIELEYLTYFFFVYRYQFMRNKILSLYKKDKLCLLFNLQ